jgi:hypothetical protein
MNHQLCGENMREVSSGPGGATKHLVAFSPRWTWKRPCQNELEAAIPKLTIALSSVRVSRYKACKDTLRKEKSSHG